MIMCINYVCNHIQLNCDIVNTLGAEQAQLVRWMTETGDPRSNLTTAIWEKSACAVATVGQGP